ncbi:hypothetical protein AOLI_G00044030 [Acnodon oligacanthus]
MTRPAAQQWRVSGGESDGQSRAGVKGAGQKAPLAKNNRERQEDAAAPRRAGANTPQSAQLNNTAADAQSESPTETVLQAGLRALSCRRRSAWPAGQMDGLTLAEIGSLAA